MNWEVATDIAAALAGLSAGVLGGFRMGVRWGSPVWRYWAMNAGALVVCLAICALFLALGLRWLAVLVLGVLGGVLTGMKYGIRGGFVIHPGVALQEDAEPDETEPVSEDG